MFFLTVNFGLKFQKFKINRIETFALKWFYKIFKTVIKHLIFSHTVQPYYWAIRYNKMMETEGRYPILAL